MVSFAQTQSERQVSRRLLRRYEFRGASRLKEVGVCVLNRLRRMASDLSRAASNKLLLTFVNMRALEVDEAFRREPLAAAAAALGALKNGAYLKSKSLRLLADCRRIPSRLLLLLIILPLLLRLCALKLVASSWFSHKRIRRV